MRSGSPTDRTTPLAWAALAVALGAALLAALALAAPLPVLWSAGALQIAFGVAMLGFTLAAVALLRTRERGAPAGRNLAWLAGALSAALVVGLWLGFAMGSWEVVTPAEPAAEAPTAARDAR